MINNKDWLNIYEMLDQDDQYFFKEFILNEEQKIVLLNYDRFKEALYLVASDPNNLKDDFFVEDIALTFDDQCKYIGNTLKEQGYFDEEIHNKIMDIDKQLNLLDRNHNNWTIFAMKNNMHWIKARNLANELINILKKKI